MLVTALHVRVLIRETFKQLRKQLFIYSVEGILILLVD